MEKEKDSALSHEVWKQLKRLENVDILVGIPSYNNAHTINYVVYQAAKGLDTYFPDLKSAIFISDGDSTDGTLETVKAVNFPFQACVIPTIYKGTSGKGSAVKAIFEAARFLNVKAVALVDSDLRSITPEWIKQLISPTMKGTGFVTPFYVRHKYDGTITNFLCFPTTSSLYGKKIRQPIGGDFGLSIELVNKLLESPLWQRPFIHRFGIDIFETHIALAENFDIKQAFLGRKIHEAKDPSKHLASMFKQVTASLFTCIWHYEKAWKEIKGCKDIEIVGDNEISGDPEEIHVDLANLMRTYKEGFDTYKQIYQTILSKDIFKEIQALRKLEDYEMLSKESWAKIVYTFCANYKNEKRLGNEKLLDAFRILWVGKVSTFVKQTLDLDTMKAEKIIEEEARNFEKLKPYLLEIF